MSNVTCFLQEVGSVALRYSVVVLGFQKVNEDYKENLLKAFSFSLSLPSILLPAISAVKAMTDASSGKENSYLYENKYTI
jgi:hypothetical protein